jgi:hypothetical protein
MKNRRRKTIPQFELGFPGEPFRLAGESQTVPALSPIRNPPDPHQLALFSESTDTHVGAESTHNTSHSLVGENGGTDGYCSTTR